MLPSEIVGGGITGLSALIYYATGIPVAITLIIMNLILLSTGVKARGITLLNGQGWYSREESAVLVVVVCRHEASMVFRAIKEVGPEAFISVANVMGVYGKGFDPIKY